MVYKYSWNGPERKVSAEVVAHHLQKLEVENGEVTREAFLDSARPKTSKMHCLFEWDDAKAAEQYRLTQAQTIIASIHVEVQTVEQKPIEIRAFVQDREVSSGYVSIRSAFDDEDKQARILAMAKRDAEWLRAKYENLVSFAEVIKALDKFLEVA